MQAKMRRGRYSMIKGMVKGPPEADSFISDDVPCPSCRKGVVEEVVRIKRGPKDYGIDIRKSTCTECGGTGWVPNRKIQYVKSLSELSVGRWIQSRRRMMKKLSPVFVMKIEEDRYTADADVFVFDFDQNDVERYTHSEIVQKKFFFCSVHLETFLE